ncbi:MAG: class I SAM-dependent methyltransferase [Flavobacteriales bacterium]|nr:class I SAM-dependent methyltransferase [Flavobacteriales bacterium]MBL6872651.1 class I SAM-dependent methyltransferase [Flavobacteriales bacterium]
MKKLLLKTLRPTFFILIVDYLFFLYHYIKSTTQRLRFKKSNPHIILPPAYYMYEAFGISNYNTYYFGSIETAKHILKRFNKYMPIDNIKLLDWGCGTARVIRHFPKILSPNCICYGTDYNLKYINWCTKNIKNIQFSTNQLYPPTNYNENTFDAIYGISIFTHLSEELHYKWFDELIRILKPNGTLQITLSGEAFINKLSDEEKERFFDDKLIEHKSIKVVHRSFASHHPKNFIHKLVGKHKVLEHIAGDIINGKATQDIWLIRKVN